MKHSCTVMLPALSSARGISRLVREYHFLGSLPNSTPDVVQASGRGGAGSRPDDLHPYAS